jgi:hypothetical protein
MSMKKTDMEKNMAKKLGGRLKAEAIPQRFGAGSAAPAVKKEKPAPVKTISLTVRLPAELAAGIHERAVGQEGGASAVVAKAVEQWLASAASEADKGG